jgi:hypothetical protein
VHRVVTTAALLWLACKPQSADQREPRVEGAPVAPKPAPELKAQVTPTPTPAPFSVVGRSSLGFFIMIPASDGSLFVVAGDDHVAGARAGQRTLAVDQAWTEFSEHHEFQIGAVGGRWPADIYVSGWMVDYGPEPWPVVVSRTDGTWSELSVPSKSGYVGYYASYHALADGTVLAVQVQEPEPSTWELEEDAPQRARVRNKKRRPARPPPPVWTVLLGSGPPPPPPPTREVQALAALPGGGHAILVMPFEVLRVGPGERRWTSLPGLGAGFERSVGGSLAVDPGGRLYVGNCGGRPSRLMRWVDTRWELLDSPNDECILSLAFDGEGTLWIAQKGLYRRRQGGDWEEIPVTADGYANIKTSGAHFVLLPDGVLWVQEAEVEGSKLIVTNQPGWTARDLNRRFAPLPGR